MSSDENSTIRDSVSEGRGSLLKWSVAALALVALVLFALRGLTSAWTAPAPAPPAASPPTVGAPGPPPSAPIDAALAQAKHMEAERIAMNRRRLREYEQLARDALADLAAADQQIDAWSQIVEGLLSAERGKQISGDERLVEDFRAIVATDRPGKTRVQALRSGVTELMKPIDAAIADDDGTYTPGVALVDQLQKDRLAAQAITTAYREAQTEMDALLQRANAPGELTLRAAIAALDARRVQHELETRAELAEHEAERDEALRPFLGQWLSHRSPYGFRIADTHPKIVLSEPGGQPAAPGGFTITSFDGRTFIGRERLSNGSLRDLTGALLGDDLLYIRTKTQYLPFHRADGDPPGAQARVADQHVERMKAFFTDPDSIRAYLPTMVLSAQIESADGWMADQMGKYYDDESQFLALFARNLARSDEAKYGKASLDWDDWLEGWKFTQAGKDLIVIYETMLADPRYQSTPYDAFRFALESRSLREREFRTPAWLNERIGMMKAKGDALTKSEKQKLAKLESWRGEIMRRKLKPPPDPIRP